MKIADLGLGYQQQLDNIGTLAGNGLWQAEARGVLARAAQDIPGTDDLLQLLNEMQRLERIAVAGLAGDAAFRQAVTAQKLATWQDFGAPPASLELQHSLARKLYNADPAKKDVGMIKIGDGAREVGKWLVEKCRADGVPFLVDFADADFSAFIINHTDESGIKALAANAVARAAPVTKMMTARPGLPDKQYAIPDVAKTQLMNRELLPLSSRTSSGELFYTLTVIPTKKDAEVDGIPYADYVKLFFEMCDEPWAEIGAAQVALIREFNSASTVRITNSDGTDISMSLVDHDGSHFTFCNSLIAKNVPGSEIFSAMRRDSLEGKVVAKGRFSHQVGKICENLTLEFEKGRLVRWHAEKGQDYFQEEIGVDDGAKFVGELGIGTNPHLKQHVVNGLLVEKIGGSFHLALGRAYSYTSYMGDPVKVDNGNKSALHWDITTLLRGREGRMYLDGRLVMDHGQWLGEKYDVLNRGWEAIPREQRPEYWKDYYDKPAGLKP